jgi:hydroxypyruvate isomerase
MDGDKTNQKFERRESMKEEKLSRRTFIRYGSVMAAGTIAGVSKTRAASAEVKGVVKKGRINQSVCKWCYGKFSLDELCEISKKMGIKAIDLLGPGDFPTVKKHGLACSMVSTHGLTKGINRKENHEQCLARIRDAIDAAAEYEFPNVITFPGNRRGMPDDEGIQNSVIALKQIAGHAEKKKVTICMEYLNSKVNHKDYMFDKMAWGVEVCKKVGSERVKILYDIYHAQIMEGDIIRTIRDNNDYIGHYHTGGNPGRNEIDETQELYYPAIMRAIADTGFKGYVAHEFIPKRDPIQSLAYAVRICDV